LIPLATQTPPHLDVTVNIKVNINIINLTPETQHLQRQSHTPRPRLPAEFPGSYHHARTPR
jgi:hypothetical protein